MSGTIHHWTHLEHLFRYNSLQISKSLSSYGPKTIFKFEVLLEHFGISLLNNSTTIKMSANHFKVSISIYIMRFGINSLYICLCLRDLKMVLTVKTKDVSLHLPLHLWLFSSRFSVFSGHFGRIVSCAIWLVFVPFHHESFIWLMHSCHPVVR